MDIDLLRDYGVNEDKLLLAAKAILEETEGRNACPGWRILLAQLKPDFVDVGPISLPTLNQEQASNLVYLAASDPHAFDAASYLAGIQITLDGDFHPALRDFSAGVLMGEIKRPPQLGRKPNDKDIPLKLYQYFLCCLTEHGCDLDLANNRESKREPRPTVCGVVADAFTKAGRYTTKNELVSLFYDDAYTAFRKLAESCGIKRAE